MLGRMSWIVELDGLPEGSARFVGGLLEARTGGRIEQADARVRLVLAERPAADLPDAVAGWLTMLGSGAIAVRSRGPGSGGWVEGWGAVLPPVTIGRFEIASPHDAGPVAEDRTRLVVDAPRSFGGGAHPTTRLAALLLQELPLEDARVLDVGTGSGVLALLAARSGARVTAIDVDAASVEDARRNAARNGAEEAITFAAGPLDEVEGPFDVVVANVFLAAILEMAPALEARCRHTLLLSGLRKEEAETARAAFPSLVDAGALVEDGWCALHLRRAR